ncbi:MAG: ATP-dependent DNA helicase RecG [Candidatus Daviesbacteria bacterium]|nr:ATP-dependent DNA helicase RecG [Candidatus Daviesbacteria bacterium]
MDLHTSLSYLTGIGPSLIFKLKRLNLNTLEDLIYHFPFRYDDFSAMSTAKDTQIGQIVTLQGEIWSIKNVYTRARKVLTQAIFNDETTPITLTWFNQSWLAKQIQVGDRLQISGKMAKYKNKLSIIMPKWEKLESLLPLRGPTAVSHQPLHTGKLVAVYPETEKLTSRWFRTKISQVLPQVIEKIDDPLPKIIKADMLDLSQALHQIHFPQNWQEVEKSRERLGFDELFFVSLATQKVRLAWQKKPLIHPLKINKLFLKEFIKKLPFELTGAQERVLQEILNDLKKTHPMNRLLQGEVGSGKTVVATLIAYLVYKNGLRTLFMAPTEILTFQHYETISKLLTPFGIKVGIYTGSKKSVESSDVIVGTHALLSSKLNISDVGLIIVDEQQRFGVEQRSFLRNRAKLPHFLTMTATPIPRTVALTLYGDLDLSVIDELPKERLRVKTYVVPSSKRNDAYKFIEKKIKEGDQAYVITPLIDLSETIQSARAATEEFKKLKTKVLPKLRLGLLHGRLSSKDKEKVMGEFKKDKIDILVSTSVVEVGMDIANATIMVIESAERFGLAQLHQLRGRVGRGYKQSYCLLFSELRDSQSISRLKNLEKIHEGIKLAELDLKIRGSGEIFGKKQSGRFDFKIASFSNLTLLEKTKLAAQNLLKTNPTLDKYPLLKRKLDELSAQAMPD